jgi:hypothetical protein
MVADVFAFAFVVDIVNVADVLPDGMVTVFGTVVELRLLESVMTRPAGGAAELIVTVPLLDLP